MMLLLDIGNTNTHLGLANSRRVVKQATVPTAAWFDGDAKKSVTRFVGRAPVEGAALCSVVPRATPLARRAIKEAWRLPCLQLTPATLRGVGIAYPKPETIGPDRLANAVAVRHRFGAPSVVVDFGTAVTFDVVDRAGNYVGGIIAVTVHCANQHRFLGAFAHGSLDFADFDARQQRRLLVKIIRHCREPWRNDPRSEERRVG